MLAIELEICEDIEKRLEEFHADAPASVSPDGSPQPTQVPIDMIDEASMESFPCSDPPSYTTTHI